MALLLSHLDTSSLGAFKSSWLVLSLLFGSASAVCPLPPVSDGAKLTTITHNGISRSWYTYVPASVAAAQAVVPLVMDLHAIYQCVTQDDTQLYTGWLSKAEEFGFIAVWPQAVDEPIGENGVTGFQWDARGPIGARWNAGMCDECNGFSYTGQFVTCCVDAPDVDAPDATAKTPVISGQNSRDLQAKTPVISGQNLPSNNADDVGFLREVVAQVAAAHNPVDTTRIYITGHSYGCMMAQRFLAQASDLVAAVACFAGALTLANDLGVTPLAKLSSEYTPRPLMVIHGNADTVVPYEPAATIFSAYSPDSPYSALGAEGNLALWGGYNGCPGLKATETPNENYTLHEIDCNGIVSALVEVAGVGHHPFYNVGGVVSGTAHYGVTVQTTTAPFDTTQLAWDFLKTASIVQPPSPLPPSSPPSSPPSANKYCKKLKRLQKWKKQEEKWEKKCSAHTARRVA